MELRKRQARPKRTVVTGVAAAPPPLNHFVMRSATLENRRVRNAIDDILLGLSQSKEVSMEFEQLDWIADQCLTIARARYGN